jgi:hypothetical protein
VDLKEKRFKRKKFEEWQIKTLNILPAEREMRIWKELYI